MGRFPIVRSPNRPIRVACFLIMALIIGCDAAERRALCGLQPSPPWGRGWTAARVFFSGGGPGLRPLKGYGRPGRSNSYGSQAGEGVAGPRLSVRGSRAGSTAAGNTSSLDEFVHQFESSYHAVRTIRANFTQTYVSAGNTRIESGVVYFARGGLMRWDYEQPQSKLFLSDGKSLLLYIPEEKQLTRSSLKASDDLRVPFRLLLSRLELRRVFSRLELTPGAIEHQPADRVLRGYPKKAFREDYQQVLMVISPQFDIRRLLVTLPDRSTMEFDFDHIERDVPLGRPLFRFTPPPGTEVIDQQ